MRRHALANGRCAITASPASAESPQAQRPGQTTRGLGGLAAWGYGGTWRLRMCVLYVLGSKWKWK